MVVERGTRLHLLAATAAALGLPLYACYFDWSDRLLFLAIGLTLLAVAMRHPRASLLAALSLWVMTAGHIILPRTAAKSLAPGQPWFEVERVLGRPTAEGPTLPQAAAAIDGYSQPSPWRYPIDVPVAVYVRGDTAIWVFHEKGHVLALFEGGS